MKTLKEILLESELQMDEDFDLPSTELLQLTESEFQGKKVELNKPFRTPVRKRSLLSTSTIEKVKL